MLQVIDNCNKRLCRFCNKLNLTNVNLHEFKMTFNFFYNKIGSKQTEPYKLKLAIIPFLGNDYCLCLHTCLS